MRARLYVHEGAVYLIRDVFDGTHFLGCEFAQLSDECGLSWTPCREGVDFKDIQPLGSVSHSPGDWVTIS